MLSYANFQRSESCLDTCIKIPWDKSNVVGRILLDLFGKLFVMLLFERFPGGGRVGVCAYELDRNGTMNSERHKARS